MPQANAAVTLRFELDAREWGRAELAASQATPRWRMIWLACRVAPIVVPLPFAAAILLGARPIADVIDAAVPWELLALLFSAIFPVWRRVIAPLQARRLQGRPEERTISPAGLDVAGSLDATFVPWAQMRWVCESADFFLFRSPRATYYVPKHLLSPDQDAQLRSLVAQNTGAPIRMLPGAGRAT
jgi:hypothetical protein